MKTINRQTQEVQVDKHKASHTKAYPNQIAEKKR